MRFFRQKRNKEEASFTTSKNTLEYIADLEDYFLSNGFCLGFLQSIHRWHCNSTNKLADFDYWGNASFYSRMSYQAARIWPGLEDSATTWSQYASCKKQPSAQHVFLLHSAYHNRGPSLLYWTFCFPSASPTNTMWVPERHHALRLFISAPSSVLTPTRYSINVSWQKNASMLNWPNRRNSLFSIIY